MKKWAPATPTHHHDCLRQNIDTDMSEKKGEWKEKSCCCSRTSAVTFEANIFMMNNLILWLAS
jgi:hypothetical protein